MIKIIDNLRRRRTLRNITGNQGFVVETEDKIICYIQKEKCKKPESYCGETEYHIQCMEYKEKYKDLVEKYNLDKKVVYVLDGLVIKGIVEIKDGTCDLEIKNCNFSGSVDIRIFGNCTIKNTNINPRSLYGEISISAQELLIEGTSIGEIDRDIRTYVEKASISASSLIKIKNSKIGIGDIILGRGTKCINMENSTFKAKDVDIWANDITTKLSNVTANHLLAIRAEKFNELTVKAPFIHFDGVLLNHRDGSKFYSLKPTNEKQNYRRAIIEQLKGIKGNLEEQRQQILDGVGKQIDSQRVARLYQRVRKQRRQLTIR